MEDPTLNALSPHYRRVFGEKYSQLYDDNITGKRLAHQYTIEEFRQRNDGIATFGTQPGPEIGEISSVEVPLNNPPATAKLLVYKPADFQPGQKRPIYCNYHGGGWVLGDAGDDASFLRRVVKDTGAIVLDFAYRSAPEHKYPVPIDDCWTALLWVRENAEKLGGDASRIAVGGFSAGGHIAALMSIRARDAGIPGICFQLLVIPVTDASALDTNLEVSPDTPHKSWTEHHDAPFLSHARMSWFYRYFLPEPPTEALLQDPALSPLLTKSLANLPPALVVPADVDVLRDEGIAYGRRLGAENDAFTELWLARDVPHPFPLQVAATDRAVEFADKAILRLNQAFKGELRRKKFVSNVEA